MEFRRSYFWNTSFSFSSNFRSFLYNLHGITWKLFLEYPIRIFLQFPIVFVQFAWNSVEAISGIPHSHFLAISDSFCTIFMEFRGSFFYNTSFSFSWNFGSFLYNMHKIPWKLFWDTSFSFSSNFRSFLYNLHGIP